VLPLTSDYASHLTKQFRIPSYQAFTHPLLPSDYASQITKRFRIQSYQAFTHPLLPCDYASHQSPARTWCNLDAPMPVKGQALALQPEEMLYSQCMRQTRQSFALMPVKGQASALQPEEMLYSQYMRQTRQPFALMPVRGQVSALQPEEMLYSQYMRQTRKPLTDKKPTSIKNEALIFPESSHFTSIPQYPKIWRLTEKATSLIYKKWVVNGAQEVRGFYKSGTLKC